MFREVNWTFSFVFYGKGEVDRHGMILLIRGYFVSSCSSFIHLMATVFDTSQCLGFSKKDVFMLLFIR